MSGARHERELLDLDGAHVWHPYGPMPATIEPLLVASASGVRLRLADGRELIDGMASWWCAVHGYRHPALDEAARVQLEQMAHVMFGGLTHEPAVTLAAALLERVPDELAHVFFADSGSVAVEVAIKMCLQHARSRGSDGKTRMLSLRGGYHGDTLGAMSVCDPLDGMHRLFADVLPAQLFASRPPGGVDAELDGEYAAELVELFERHAGELAAAIVEPVVQGAGGMWFYSPRYLKLLRELCDAHDVLLVFDEIATGFGRSGTYFACERAAVAPDVMCVGKALTGGYLTLSATLCSPSVAEAITRGEGGALMHGPTYMANPLACAVALASIELLDTSGWRNNVERIEQGLSKGLAPAAATAGVSDVRTLGAIGVLELDHLADIAAATKAAVAAGVWLRPFRNLIYAMPPYITSDDEVAAITEAMIAAAAAG
ncbi:MAG: adenosylmethionine--8-amino-7-oxononanoate transaminase [Solirubrobacteraceae bacterium]|jgi:adenosylmethionine-8-amino-7-oxononanoate aminotransferase